MPIARFKDLCLDVNDVAVAQAFWAAVLRLQPGERPGQDWLDGDHAEQRVWLNVVAEPKSVKHRVHLDVTARSVADVEALGAAAAETFPHWTVMRDPEGAEFCVFVRDDLPRFGLKDIVVDSQDPERIASWWHSVLGGELGHDDENPWWWLDAVPGAPVESIDFVEVPEPKTAKNRVHWDVDTESVDALIAAGATLLRAKGGDIGWDVLADPDGNEFCAFTP